MIEGRLAWRIRRLAATGHDDVPIACRLGCDWQTVRRILDQAPADEASEGIPGGEDRSGLEKHGAHPGGRCDPSDATTHDRRAREGWQCDGSRRSARPAILDTDTSTGSASAPASGGAAGAPGEPRTPRGPQARGAARASSGATTVEGNGPTGDPKPGDPKPGGLKPGDRVRDLLCRRQGGAYPATVRRAEPFPITMRRAVAGAVVVYDNGDWGFGPVARYVPLLAPDGAPDGAPAP